LVLSIPKVLVISKRPASLCATKAMFDQAGFEVAVVTNIQTASALARRLVYRAAVVCFHSFTLVEREELLSGLKSSNPELQIVAQCPGCLGCDEGRLDVLGTLPAEDTTIPQIVTIIQPADL
jgi:hypothetical protein